MIYQRAREIEQRLDTVLNLIRSGDHSTPELAEKLKVSVPTVSRCITALRQRGYVIRSTRRARHWAYEFVAEPASPSQPEG
jgi:Mn-dependent DtxR family transcriptional regulator